MSKKEVHGSNITTKIRILDSKPENFSKSYKKKSIFKS
jgi:hypothetical protein